MIKSSQPIIKGKEGPEKKHSDIFHIEKFDYYFSGDIITDWMGKEGLGGTFT